jgi:hypothetical protein
MIEVKLSNGEIWKFKEDISLLEFDSIGEEPTIETSKKEALAYNKRKICAFSHTPKLNMEMLDAMQTLDYVKVFSEVVQFHSNKIKDFLSPPQKHESK